MMRKIMRVRVLLQPRQWRGLSLLRMKPRQREIYKNNKMYKIDEENIPKRRRHRRHQNKVKMNFAEFRICIGDGLRQYSNK